MANTKHDNAVRKKISRLKREGWKNIEADIPGYDTPNPIGEEGRIPDIVATKPGNTVIIEVEPADAVEAHKEQHATFRRHAGQKNRTKFELLEF